MSQQVISGFCEFEADGAQVAVVGFTTPVQEKYRNTTTLDPSAFTANSTIGGEITEVAEDGTYMNVRFAEHICNGTTPWTFDPTKWPADVFVEAQSGTAQEF